MAVIQCDQLTKRYGSRIGVEGLSMEVDEGSLFGFLGPNGSGKTTTIRVLLGLLHATDGTASIFGLDCWRRSHVIKREVGYVPGDLRLYPWLTLTNALSIFGHARGCDLNGPGLELAELLELDPHVNVRRMSRGMRQKLGLILALAHRPRLLILDEPTTALDPLMQEVLCRHLRELAGAGHTIFFSSHTLDEVERLCDRVAILRRGRLVADETLESLRTRATRTVTIHWQSGVDQASVKPPPVLDLHRREKHWWEATLTGPVMDLIPWAAAQPIEDLSIAKPDLSRVFQQYYVDAEAES